ncbi:hypothetical protein SAMN04488021_1823 [Paracoccus aminovorans]|uniref:GIY-YIG domain-containing protein n=1 Tax=Paracoccus aminovorans TaxID=34004 RepID=A0A1I3FKY5_9RHOB|nr:hypothetical protein [Paracoccus aminovorans]CQR86815.1 hypothetical protein JCM7685_2259 [Paracoccus aminovorans]SFI11928.1 hypothetical protein SAMN04488021_1823 [Paracoccus aminovorans]
MSARTIPHDRTPSGATSVASLHRVTLPGQMLQRGFWLYVWRVQTPKGERLYVGRTGDSSSPHATAPYTRMGQHLGFSKAQNSLRRLLIEAGVEPESCGQFDLISYGPIFPEIGMTKDQLRADQMLLHTPVRDQMAALEKKLRDALVEAGHPVLNVVHSKKQYDAAQWEAVRNAFAEHFSGLGRIES